MTFLKAFSLKSKTCFWHNSPWVILIPSLPYALVYHSQMFPRYIGPFQLSWIFFSMYKEIAISFFLFLYWPLNAAVPSIVMLPSPGVKRVWEIWVTYIQERLQSAHMHAQHLVSTCMKWVVFMSDTLKSLWLYVMIIGQHRTILTKDELVSSNLRV